MNGITLTLDWTDPDTQTQVGLFYRETPDGPRWLLCVLTKDELREYAAERRAGR